MPLGGLKTYFGSLIPSRVSHSTWAVSISLTQAFSDSGRPSTHQSHKGKRGSVPPRRRPRPRQPSWPGAGFSPPTLDPEVDLGSSSPEERDRLRRFVEEVQTWLQRGENEARVLKLEQR